MKFDFNNVDFDKIEKLTDILHNSIPEDSSVFEVVAATVVIQAEVITKYSKDTRCTCKATMYIKRNEV
jgi:hypothetical protein